MFAVHKSVGLKTGKTVKLLAIPVTCLCVSTLVLCYVKKGLCSRKSKEKELLLYLDLYDVLPVLFLDDKMLLRV